MAKDIRCPKCKRYLHLAGEVTIADESFQGTFPVYQCDDCLVAKTLMGKEIGTALTLVETLDGKLRDPDTLQVIG